MAWIAVLKRFWGKKYFQYGIFLYLVKIGLKVLVFKNVLFNKNIAGLWLNVNP